MNSHSSLHSRTLSQFLSITQRQQRISRTSLVPARAWFGAWFHLRRRHHAKASPALSPQALSSFPSIQPDPGVRMTSSSLGVSLLPSALSHSLLPFLPLGPCPCKSFCSHCSTVGPESGLPGLAWVMCPSIRQSAWLTRRGRSRGEMLNPDWPGLGQSPSLEPKARGQPPSCALVEVRVPQPGKEGRKVGPEAATVPFI